MKTIANGLEELARAVASAPSLPCCHHGNPLCDWAGDKLVPSCGCKLEAQAESTQRHCAAIKLGLHLKS